MRQSNFCVLIAAFHLGGCATAYHPVDLGRAVNREVPTSYSARIYVPVRISSRSAAKFYFIRMDIYNSRGTTDQQRRAAVEHSQFYGPLSVGQTVELYAGATYLIIPTCSGALAWSREAEIVAPFLPGEIMIDC